MDLYKYERAEDRKLVKRIHVMRELRDSERLYVADLRTLVEVSLRDFPMSVYADGHVDI